MNPRKALPPLVLVVSLFMIYMRTLAPGLSWANAGGDGGDLIAAASTGGIAHPTGYPLYLLLARLAQFLPLGPLAFRTNLLSAVMAVLGAWLLHLFVARVLSRSGTMATSISALTSALAFGLAPLVWSQAVITEVYSLQAALTIALLYIYTLPSSTDPLRRRLLDLWRGLLLGLALCNQVTTLLLLPAFLVAGALRRIAEADAALQPRRAWFQYLRFERWSLLRQLTGMGAGLSVYLLIPFRALTEPPINWGNAITPARFWWLVSGQLYQGYYLQLNLDGWWERITGIAQFLLGQFGVPGLALGVAGLVLFGARTGWFLLTCWVAGASLLFSMVYQSSDSDVYLISLLLCFAVWMGLGMHGLIISASRWTLWMPSLGILTLVYFGCRIVTVWPEVDASHDQRAEAFGMEVMSMAPENAILFAQGDESVFALWYFHHALGARRDIVVAAEDLLHFDWYQETLRSTYPSLNVPGPFPWPETIALANPSRPICYVRYQETPEITCSPPP